MDTEYNGNIQHPSASVMGKVSGDNVSVDEYGFPASDDGKSAGSHAVFVKSLKGTDKDNYKLEGSSTNYTEYSIDPKPMTITADDKEKAIDDEEDPELTASVDGNIETEIFVKDEDYELSCEDHPHPEVEDEYDIYVKVKGTSALAKNYQITTKNGTLTIVDNKPTITPDSFTITYGDDYPELTATTKNLDDGFNLVKGTDFTLDRVTGDDYGEYKISVTLIEGSPNVQHYGKNNIRLKEGLFTINQYSVPIT
ncbi:MAG: MBG domain-containing protein [Coriobacteriia bacterium]|nr:MBG domain-containing protein [Coriobacteriia bacterium]